MWSHSAADDKLEGEELLLPLLSPVLSLLLLSVLLLLLVVDAEVELVPSLLELSESTLESKELLRLNLRFLRWW